MVDVNDAAVQRGLGTIDGSLERLLKKDKLTAADKQAALARVKGSTQYADLKSVELVIEAATENLELKLRILKQIGRAGRRRRGHRHQYLVDLASRSSPRRCPRPSASSACTSSIRFR